MTKPTFLKVWIVIKGSSGIFLRTSKSTCPSKDERSTEVYGLLSNSDVTIKDAEQKRYFNEVTQRTIRFRRIEMSIVYTTQGRSGVTRSYNNKKYGITFRIGRVINT